MTKTYGEHLAARNKKTAENMQLIAEGKLKVTTEPIFIRASRVAEQNQVGKEGISLVGTQGALGYRRNPSFG